MLSWWVQLTVVTVCKCGTVIDMQGVEVLTSSFRMSRSQPPVVHPHDICCFLQARQRLSWRTLDCQGGNGLARWLSCSPLRTRQLCFPQSSRGFQIACVGGSSGCGQLDDRVATTAIDGVGFEFVFSSLERKTQRVNKLARVSQRWQKPFVCKRPRAREPDALSEPVVIAKIQEAQNARQTERVWTRYRKRGTRKSDDGRRKNLLN